MKSVAVLMEVSGQAGGNDGRAQQPYRKLEWENAYSECEDFRRIVQVCETLGTPVWRFR